MFLSSVSLPHVVCVETEMISEEFNHTVATAKLVHLFISLHIKKHFNRNIFM